MQLKKDLQRLFVFIAKKSSVPSFSMATPQSTIRAPESMMAEIVEAVGLTKSDVEGYGTRLSQTFRDIRESNHESSVEEEMSDGGQSIVAPIILQPRVNTENIAGEEDQPEILNPFNQSHHPLS